MRNGEVSGLPPPFSNTFVWAALSGIGEETVGHFSLAAPLAQQSKKWEIKEHIQELTPSAWLLTHRCAIVWLTFFSCYTSKMWEGAGAPIIGNMKTGIRRKRKLCARRVRLNPALLAEVKAFRVPWKHLDEEEKRTFETNYSQWAVCVNQYQSLPEQHVNWIQSYFWRAVMFNLHFTFLMDIKKNI